MQRPLKVRDLLRCPHCRRWHPVVKWHVEGTAYTLRMLYFECRGKWCYAGPENLEPPQNEGGADDDCEPQRMFDQ